MRAVVDAFFAREGPKMRTAVHPRLTFDRLILPRLGGRPIHEIRRGEIIRLLNFIEDDRGPAMAEQSAKMLGRPFSWYAVRYKSNNDTLIPLSAKARALLADIPRIGPGDFVFTFNGRKPVTINTISQKTI